MKKTCKNILVFSLVFLFVFSAANCICSAQTTQAEVPATSCHEGPDESENSKKTSSYDHDCCEALTVVLKDLSSEFVITGATTFEVAGIPAVHRLVPSGSLLSKVHSTRYDPDKIYLENSVLRV